MPQNQQAETTQEEQQQFEQEAKNLLELFGEMIGYAQSHVNDRIELAKLEAAERSAKVASSSITVALLTFIFMMAVVFGSVALGLFIGEWIDSYSYAFLIIFGGYVVLGIIIAIFRKALVTNPVLTIIIKSMYK